MSVSINSNLMLSSVQNTERTAGSDALGKDAFLKILMTQLRNQDPMNPMEDKEFISQMATFSSLEQMTNMNSSIEKLVQINTQNSLIEYSHFVGREITWHKLQEDEEGQENKIIEGKGIIQSVQFTGDTVKFFMDDGTELTPANISEVNETGSASPIIQASTMIGREITWKVGEQEKQAIVNSVVQKNGKVTLLTNSNESVTLDSLVKIT